MPHVLVARSDVRNTINLRDHFAVVMICTVGHGLEGTTAFLLTAERGKIQNVKKSRNWANAHTMPFVCVCENTTITSRSIITKESRNGILISLLSDFLKNCRLDFGKICSLWEALLSYTTLYLTSVNHNSRTVYLLYCLYKSTSLSVESYSLKCP
jgi:hypothetical protein